MVVVIGILGYLGLNKSKINHRGQGATMQQMLVEPTFWEVAFGTIFACAPTERA